MVKSKLKHKSKELFLMIINKPLVMKNLVQWRKNNNKVHQVLKRQTKNHLAQAFSN
jgi:hypothetical protein